MPIVSFVQPRQAGIAFVATSCAASDASSPTTASIGGPIASSIAPNASLVRRGDASSRAIDAVMRLNAPTKAAAAAPIPMSGAFVVLDGALLVPSDASIAIDGAIRGKIDAIAVIDDTLMRPNEALFALDDAFRVPIDAVVAFDDAITGAIGATSGFDASLAGTSDATKGFDDSLGEPRSATASLADAFARTRGASVAHESLTSGQRPSLRGRPSSRYDVRGGRLRLAHAGWPNRTALDGGLRRCQRHFCDR